MNDNIFEKIDKQSQTLGEVADKLDGVSVGDLYALAKRTWDYKDYEMAQKYYNHISLLHPLDWKAPFMASLCGCFDKAEVTEWEQRPKAISRYYESTVSYIQNRDMGEEEKSNDILQVAEITFDIWREYIRIYLIPDNKTSFDGYCPNFKRELQKAIMAFIKHLDGYNADIFRTKQAEICKMFADFISDHCRKDHSIAIEKEDLEKYILPYHSDIRLDENVDNAVLTQEQEIEIKLKGKCYFVYKDKEIEKRARKKDILFAALLIVATCITILIPLIEAKGQWIACTAFPCLPIILYFLYCGFGNQQGIKQDSLLNSSRRKYRLTSEGGIVCESIFSPIKIVAFLLMFSLVPYFFLYSFTVKAQYSVALCAMLVLSYVIEYGCIYAFWYKNIKPLDEYQFIRRIEYKGKAYFFAK